MLFDDNLSFSIQSGLFRTLNIKYLFSSLKRAQDMKMEHLPFNFKYFSKIFLFTSHNHINTGDSKKKNKKYITCNE